MEPAGLAGGGSM